MEDDGRVEVYAVGTEEELSRMAACCIRVRGSLKCAGSRSRSRW